jgi:hypothetical protein
VSKKHKKKGKTGVPTRKLKYGLTEADFRKCVKQYVVSKMVREYFKEARIEVFHHFFVGVVQGYEDMFKFMHLKDKEFMEVFKELEADSMKLEAQQVIDKLQAAADEKAPRLITDLTGVKGSRELKAAQEIFDKQIKKTGVDRK